MLCLAATEDCRLTHGINLESRKTFSGNQFSTFDSPRDFPQRISSENVRRNREAIPLQSKGKASLMSEDGQNYGTIPMPTFASRPMTASSTIPVTATRIMWSNSKDSKCRNYIDKFLLIPASFSVWKTRFKTQVSNGSDFRRQLCCGSKKWRWLILFG